MSLRSIATDVVSIMGPYFIPSKANASRLTSLVTYIGLKVIESKNIDACYERIYQATSFFNEPTAVASDFPQVFKDGLFKGFLPVMGFHLGLDLLENGLIAHLTSDLIKTQIHDWLVANQEPNPRINHPHTEYVIGNDLSTLVDNTIRVLTLPINAFRIFLTLKRIYQLAAPLYTPKLPFPFNLKNGLFFSVLTIGAFMTGFQFFFETYLSKKEEALIDSKREIINKISWLKDNRQQIVSLPECRKREIMRIVEEQTAKTLSGFSFAQMGYTAKWNITHLIPRFFSILSSQIHYLFAIKASDLEGQKNLLLVIDKSVDFFWNFIYFAQNAANLHSNFQMCLKKINEFRSSLSPAARTITLSENETQLKVNEISLKLGEQPIFNSFSATLPLGLIYWIKGDNGCGKSVFFRMIQGLQDGEAGSIEKPHEVLYLQPELTIDPTPMTFQELLLSHFGITEPADKNIIPKLKEFPSYKEKSFDAQEKINWAGSLSNGQKQILNWIAILHISLENREKSCLLIGDESLAHLDSKQKRQMLDLLNAWIKEGQPNKRGVILVDHGHETEKLSPVETQGQANFKIYVEDSA